MASKKRKRTINLANVKNNSKKEEKVVAPVTKVTEEEPTTPALPVIPNKPLTQEEEAIRYRNLSNFSNNEQYMEQIHSFSKKSEIITELLTDFYKVKLMKHFELLERLNVEMFNVFEALEIAIPDYRLVGKRYLNELNEECQELIPNIVILFTSGNDQYRNNNLIITVIDTSIPGHEKNPEFIKLVDHVIQLFVALFPDCAIYSESLDFDENEDVYKTIDYMFTHSNILKSLTLTEEEFFNLDNQEIYNISEDYENMEKESNNMYLNTFQLMQKKMNEEVLPSKLLLYERLLYAVDVNGKRLDENGTETSMKIKFAYPVSVELEFEAEDDKEEMDIPEPVETNEDSNEVVYNGRPQDLYEDSLMATLEDEEDIPSVSPEAMND